MFDDKRFSEFRVSYPLNPCIYRIRVARVVYHIDYLIYDCPLRITECLLLLCKAVYKAFERLKVWLFQEGPAYPFSLIYSVIYGSYACVYIIPYVSFDLISPSVKRGTNA